MMIGINKEDGDRLLEEFLVDASKRNGTTRCAEESYRIMNNYFDSQLVISSLVVNAMRQQGGIPEHVMEFERQILSALTTIFSIAEKEDVPIQLQDMFEGTDDEIVERVSQSKKINYAIQQFVSAYYQYDFFESSYPEISKML